MAVLELVNARPDWMNALGVALTRPPGVPERREQEDPWEAAEAERPRRISDDLAWLRQAMDDPADCGLRGLGDTAAVGAWVPDDPAAALGPHAGVPRGGPGRLVRARGGTPAAAPCAGAVRRPAARAC